MDLTMTLPEEIAANAETMARQADCNEETAESIYYSVLEAVEHCTNAPDGK